MLRAGMPVMTATTGWPSQNASNRWAITTDTAAIPRSELANSIRSDVVFAAVSRICPLEAPAGL